MTDALSHLAAVAAPLLHRVDALLVHAGAPADHPVWSLVRRVRALPSDAVAAVADWRSADLVDVAAMLRAFAGRYADALADVPATPPWEGAAAQAYHRRATVLRSHVDGPGEDTLVGRLRATAEYLEEVDVWVARSRAGVAQAVADVLGSAEAVVLETGGGVDAATGWADRAMADAAVVVAVHVLTPVAAACDEGRALHDRWRARLSELPLPVPAGSEGPVGRVRVGD